ncbi:MAG: hypothetical protein P1P77_17130 [Spirochaetaceae bacterium]|nr:hypothetical protein [Spirochaetaceae bacterium]
MSRVTREAARRPDVERRARLEGGGRESVENPSRAVCRKLRRKSE